VTSFLESVLDEFDSVTKGVVRRGHGTVFLKNRSRITKPTTLSTIPSAAGCGEPGLTYDYRHQTWNRRSRSGSHPCPQKSLQTPHPGPSFLALGLRRSFRPQRGCWHEPEFVPEGHELVTQIQHHSSAELVAELIPQRLESRKVGRPHAGARLHLNRCDGAIGLFQDDIDVGARGGPEMVDGYSRIGPRVMVRYSPFRGDFAG
jgi:hypothetical protein